jgi:hypothetical protein
LLSTAVVVAVDTAVAVVAPMPVDLEAVAMQVDSAVATLVALQAATQAALEALVDSRVVACTTLLTLDTRQDFAAAMSPPPARTVM